jgi:hypothetical protein
MGGIMPELTDSQILNTLGNTTTEDQKRNFEILRKYTNLQNIYLNILKTPSFKFHNNKKLYEKIAANIADIPQEDKKIILAIFFSEFLEYNSFFYQLMLDLIDAAYKKNLRQDLSNNISTTIDYLDDPLQEGDLSLEKLFNEVDAEKDNNVSSNYNFEEVLQQLRQDLQKKWEPLKDSLHIKNTTGYYGQAWVNHSLKQIIIANAGTKYDFPTHGNYRFKTFHWFKDLAKDVFNDFLVFMEMVPFQFERGAVKFIDSVIEDLSEEKDLNAYSICFVGHSLGGILSDLSAAYLLNKYPNMFHDVKSVSFDNPGSKPIVRKFLQELKNKIGYLHTDLEKMKYFCKIFNHLPNWMNAVNEQIAKVIHIKANSNETPQHNWFEKFTIIKDVIKNFADHDKSNFRKAEIFEKVTNWEKGLFTQYIKHPIDVSLAGLKVIKSCISSNAYKGFSSAYCGIEFSFIKANEALSYSKLSLSQNVPYYADTVKTNINGCSQAVSSKLCQSISTICSGISTSCSKANELWQDSKETISQNLPYYAEFLKNNIAEYKDYFIDELSHLKQGMGQFMILGGVDALYGDERDY